MKWDISKRKVGRDVSTTNTTGDIWTNRIGQISVRANLVKISGLHIPWSNVEIDFRENKYLLNHKIVWSTKMIIVCTEYNQYAQFLLLVQVGTPVEYIFFPTRIFVTRPHGKVQTDAVPVRQSHDSGQLLLYKVIYYRLFIGHLSFHRVWSYSLLPRPPVTPLALCGPFSIF